MLVPSRTRSKFSLTPFFGKFKKLVSNFLKPA